MLLNGLVTDGNKEIRCRGFIVALFQSNTANKLDSEQHEQYPRLKEVIPGSEVEILHQKSIKLKFYHLFRLISGDFQLKAPK